eukprot:scaffold93047_cov31-Tisochrysis_lutea.AAC.1
MDQTPGSSGTPRGSHTKRRGDSGRRVALSANGGEPLSRRGARALAVDGEHTRAQRRHSARDRLRSPWPRLSVVSRPLGRRGRWRGATGASSGLLLSRRPTLSPARPGRDQVSWSRNHYYRQSDQQRGRDFPGAEAHLHHYWVDLRDTDGPSLIVSLKLWRQQRLLGAFWRAHDPTRTAAEGQFGVIGPSVVWAATEAESDTAKKSKMLLERCCTLRGPVVLCDSALAGCRVALDTRSVLVVLPV